MNRKGMTKGWVVGLLGMIAAFAACSEEDEYSYPSVVHEFADVATDDSHRFVKLVTDDGEEMLVANALSISTEGVVADTLYRALVSYEKQDGGALLYGLQAIPLLKPEPLQALNGDVDADPLDLQSVWRRGKYLNMVLLVKSQGGRHRFGVVEDTVIAAPDGRRSVCLQLSHDCGDDAQAYTVKHYLSVALEKYALTANDSVVIEIPTEKGWKSWKR